MPVLRAAGLTVITHGLQFDDGEPYWMDAMAQQIATRAGQDTVVMKLIIGPRTDGTLGVLSVTLDAGRLPINIGNGEVVIKLFWNKVAGFTDHVNSTYIATTVMPYLDEAITRSDGITTPPFAQMPIHLIGHSRGGSVVTEISRLLGQEGIWVDQVTTLDPHPAQGSQGLFYPDADVRIYENVLFADNYWEADEVPDLDLDYTVQGKQIMGAYNRFLAESIISHLGYAGNPFAEHFNIHLWYHATIDLGTQASYLDGSETVNITPDLRRDWYETSEAEGQFAGFHFTRIGGGTDAWTSALKEGHYNGDRGDTKFNNSPDPALRAKLDVRESHEWPNLITLKHYASGDLKSGDTFPLEFAFQSFDNMSSLEFFLDNDQNPYNDGSISLTVPSDLNPQPKTDLGIRVKNVSVTIPNSTPRGKYHLYGRISGPSLISGGQGYVRYLYSSQTVSVIPGNSITPSALTISDVVPGTLKVTPFGQTQPISIIGAGFSQNSRLRFTRLDDSFTPPDIIPNAPTPTELRCDFSEGAKSGVWSVLVIDGTLVSNSKTFSVGATPVVTYTISPYGSPLGSIFPSDPFTVGVGKDTTLTAIPKPGYVVDTWFDIRQGEKAVTRNGGNIYTLVNIQLSHVVSVTFKPATAAQQTGSLQVNIDTVYAGAQWSVDGGNYRNPGDIVTDLTLGGHTISFKGVSGYITPSDQSVTIAADEVLRVTGTYVPEPVLSHRLTVNPSTQGIVAPYPLASDNQYTSRTVVQLKAIPNPGFHFTGWAGDAVNNGLSNPASIVMDTDKTVTALFEPGDSRVGIVKVSILPQEAADAGVRWGLTETDSRASGSSYSSAPETDRIFIHLVDGWVGPNQREVTVLAGQSTNVVIELRRDLTPGLLTVTLSPLEAGAGGHWRLNTDSTAQGNGASVPLPPGASYIVTFDPVPGWTTPPASGPVTIQRGQTTVVSGIYTPPAGQPVVGAIAPPIGSLTGGTTLTINGANFTSPASVMIGDKAATDVKVLDSVQISCITPSTSAYGTAPVVVQTGAGTATNLNAFSYGQVRGRGIDLVSALGGTANAVTVQGNYAYVGEGSSVLVVDISNPNFLSLVGRVTMPGLVKHIATLGDYAYVANGDGGVQVVDIRNPKTPKLSGFYATKGYATSIAILGNRAYVIESSTLDILELINPTAPYLFSSLSFDDVDSISDVAVQQTAAGPFAYLGASSRLAIVDVSKPLSKTSVVKQISLTSDIKSVKVSGNFAFVGLPALQRVEMFDVSKPDVPVDLGFVTTPAITLSVGNDLVYAAGGPFSVIRYTSGGPSLISRTEGQFDAADSILVGSDVYLAGVGLNVVDVSTGKPSVVGSFSDSGQFVNFYAAAISENLLFACEDHGLDIFNLEVPSQPKLLGRYSGNNNGVAQIIVNKRVAYLGGYEDKTLILDVSTPSSPTLLSSIPATTVNNQKMALLGTTLFVGGQASGASGRVASFNVSSPATPKPIATFESTTPVFGLAVNGNKVVIALTNSKEIKVLDASSLVEQGTLKNVGDISDLQMSDDGHYAYFADPKSTNFAVVDVSDVTNPNLVIAVTFEGGNRPGPYTINTLGNSVYLATWNSGIHVFDLTDPVHPFLTRAYPTPGSPNGLAFLGGSGHKEDLIYAACFAGGIVVLKVDDIEPPQVFINPTFGSTYRTTNGRLSLSGTARDNIGVTRILWANGKTGGGEGQLTGQNWLINGIPLQAGSNILTVSAFDQAGNRNDATLTVVYQPPKQSQTINFPTIPDQKFGNPPIYLQAAASSGLALKLDVVSGPATLSNANLLSFTGAGTVNVRATQLGNDQFDPALGTNVSFMVAKNDQSISFPLVPDKLLDGVSFQISATASSDLSVIFSIVSGPASIVNNWVTPTRAGDVIVRASQFGNVNFNAALDVDRRFTVNKLPQFITFPALGRQVFGDAPFPLAATASSGLPVQFQVLSGAAVLSGAILTVTGPGQVTMRASQSGDDRYLAAATSDQMIIVAPGNNVVGDVQRQNGNFVFRFYAEPARVAVIESSFDFRIWTPLATNNVGPLGTVEFVGPLDQSKMFYRIKLR